MSIENQNYDNKVEADTSRPPSASGSGDGGGDMAVWFKPRPEKLQSLLNNTYTNKSSYPIPAAVLNQTYDVGGVSKEKALGIGLTGNASKVDGSTLSGSIVLQDEGGKTLGSTRVEGQFRTSVSPGPTITVGEDGPGIPQILSVFVPFKAGIPSIKEGISFSGTTTIKTTYTEGSVSVFDVNGTPVSEDSITTPTGERFITGPDGRADVLAPDGKQVQLQSFGGTHTKTVKFSQGDTKTFRYPGLTVKLERPDNGEPYEGVPIAVNGNVFKTDEYGEVNLPKLPFGTYNVNIMGIVQREITLSAEGVRERVVVGDGSSISGVKSAEVRCFDETTKRAIVDTPVEIPDLGVKSATNEEGRAATLHDLSDKFEVVVARGDPRYLTTTYTIDPSGTTDIELELEPTTNRVNM